MSDQKARSSGPGRKGRFPTVLIVDDHEILRETLELVLGEYGLDVLGTTSDADEALELALSLQPDVILVDVKMPTVEGPVLVRSLIEGGARSHIIGFSMSDDPVIEKEMRDAGASDFAFKGSSWQDLSKKIYDVVDSSPGPSNQGTAAAF